MLAMFADAMLEPAQIQKYEEDGYLIQREFVEPSACDHRRRRAEELVRDFELRDQRARTVAHSSLESCRPLMLTNSFMSIVTRITE